MAGEDENDGPDDADPAQVALQAGRRATPPPARERARAPRAAAPSATVEDLTRQLEHYRNKAVALDVLVFELRALLQSGKGFSEILNVDPLLTAFMAVCRERYASINSSVLLLDDLDDTQTFYRVRAYHNLPDHFADPSGNREEMLLFRLPVDQGLLWQLIRQGNVFSVRDMQRSPRFKTAFQKWNLDILRSDVWVPLVRGGEVLGILTLGECEDGSQIPGDEFAFLQEIASVAATNIDSTLKYEKNTRILENLRTLYDVNQQLANVNDFKKLTIETLATAVDALRAQKANLMLLNAETRRLEIKVVWGSIPAAVRDSINEGRTETRSFAIGEGVAGQAAKTGLPVRINDRAQIEQIGRNTVYCIISVPLLYGGEVMGVITLTNKVKEVDGSVELDLLGRFGEDDIQLLLGLADQAAVNLHKARLYNASITDRLTGLHNARHFETVFDERLERALRDHRPLSLAVVDIDNFKVFNDTHGHKAGDAVLAYTASLLRESVRGDGLDEVFRYGGEEFCFLCSDTDAGTARQFMDRVRQRIATSELVYEDKALRVTVSIGISTYPLDGDTRRTIFDAADRALYAAKDAGRNCVKVAASR